MEIFSSASFEKLVITGNPSQEECLNAWEKIVRRHSEVTGSFEYIIYFDALQAYAKLINDYNTIKRLLFFLVVVIDDDAIAYLKEQGYKIDNSEGPNKQMRYDASLDAAMRKSDNIMTKIQSKQKEIARLVKDRREKMGFGAVIANISDALGYQVDRQLTLEEYIEHKKNILKRQQKPKPINGNGGNS